MFQKIARETKTLTCVAVAGLFFISAIIFNIWYLIVVGAFFDWLPLPAGWMKLDKKAKKNRILIILHVVITLIAYLFAVVWIFIPIQVHKFLFMETWWLAVMLGLTVSNN